MLAAVFVLGLGSEGWDRLGPARLLSFPHVGVVAIGVLGVALMLGAALLTELLRRRLDAARAAAGQADSAGQILGGPPIGALGTRASVPVALAGAALLGAPAIALLARACSRAVRPTVVGTPA